MSAYIVDPRHIDYLVSWAHRHRRDHGQTYTTRIAGEPPGELAHAASADIAGGYRIVLVRISSDDLGRTLMRENVRSVAYRYSEPGHQLYWGDGHGMPDVAPDDLPGPVDQTRVWRYAFRPIAAELNPAWVVNACACLRYHSCETPDYEDSIAYPITQAIREDAISALTEDAPWEITDEALQQPYTV